MAIHVFDALAHVNCFNGNLGMCFLVNNKHLVGKSLPHPIDAVKIEDDLLKLLKAIAHALGL